MRGIWRLFKIRSGWILLTILGSVRLFAASVNQDEGRVPSYTLPDVLQRESHAGAITNAAQWFQLRRPELMEICVRIRGPTGGGDWLGSKGELTKVLPGRKNQERWESGRGGSAG